MELKELYQEIILDHGKNPRNKGRCNEFNSDAEGYNPLCGDKVHIYLKVGKIKKYKTRVLKVRAVQFHLLLHPYLQK